MPSCALVLAYRICLLLIFGFGVFRHDKNRDTNRFTLKSDGVYLLYLLFKKVGLVSRPK